MILAEYRVVLETTKSVTTKQAKRILSELEHPPDQEIETDLVSLIGNFLPIAVRVETIRCVGTARRR